MKITDIDFSAEGQKYIARIDLDELEVVTSFGDLRTEEGDELTENYTLKQILNEMEFERPLPEIKVGSLLHTSNGIFRVVEIDTREYSDVPRYGAMFVDDYAIQYMDNRLKGLLKQIVTDCDLLEVY
jgi:hypothetical protein